MTAKKRRPRVPLYQACPRCQPAGTAKRYSWERDLKPRIEKKDLAFTCVKCKLEILIGPDGRLIKPLKQRPSERIARTASDSYSRRELARLQGADATVRLVSPDQIPSTYEVEIKRDEKTPVSSPELSTLDEVAAHALACNGEDTVDEVASDVLAQSLETDLAKYVREQVDTLIREQATLHGRFKLLRQIGAGCNGRVVLARDLKTDKLVAVKIHFNTVDDSEPAEEARKRVSRAFELQGKVLSPYCVRPIALLVEDFGLVSVEEFVEGENLKQAVQNKGVFSELEAVHIGLQLCSVMQTAHEVLQIIHRDIKPDNVVLQPNWETRLLDWGCARSNAKDKRELGGVSLQDIEDLLEVDTETETLSIAGLIIGTPAFMSPEQVDGQRVNIQSDICSIGATLFFLVTGQNPFVRNNLGELLKAVLFDKPPHPNEVLPEGASELSKAFSKVILKAMEKKPEKRYKTPEQMKQALQACLFSDIESCRPRGPLVWMRNLLRRW